MEMTGQTVLVTGASSGLGREISILLSELGARVVLCGRSLDRLEKVRSLLSGGEHPIEAQDLGQIDSIVPWLRAVAAKHGTIDGLVHSAGVLITKPLKMLSPEDWNQGMRINVIAGSMLAKGFRQKGVCGPAGSIVFLSSVMGLTGQPGQSLYSATKGAIVAMTRSLALELARDNIRVNCVAPAVVAAGMSEQLQQHLTPEQFAQVSAAHPLGLGKAEDVAHGVAFLLAKTGRWITGTTLVIDGGYTAQ